jgi:sphingomyelin phosphodiesterase
MYYIQNYWLYEEPMERDPSGQLASLVYELDAAEKAGERAYIIGHMPMGDGDALRYGSNYFNQIVNRYKATIAVIFFGRTHRDHFEVSYADYSDRCFAGASAISYIAPSLTPTSGMPAFRVYDVDPVTFAVLDSTTYIADMINAAYQTTGPVWTKYYSAKELYGPLVSPSLTDAAAELTPAFWHNVTEVLATNADAFNDYYARKSRRWNVTVCTDDCFTEEICKLQSVCSQDNCVVPIPGHSFSKRSGVTTEPVHHDECGLSLSRSTLSNLAQDKRLLETLKRRAMGKKM